MDVKEIANRLWEDVSIIDEYLKECENLPEEHKEIVRSWKRRIKGKFMMERHLKKGTIFISMENEEVYQVSGIPTAKVDIGVYDSRIGSISYLVNEKNEELREGAWFILGKHPNYDVDNLYDPDTREYYSIKHIFEVIEKEAIKYYWMKMMFFDFLIGNRDRHQNNWAYLLPIEDKGKKVIRVRPCPLYDNGSSLCCYINEDRLDEYLGKDRNRLNALVDTKSRSAIRIDSSIKKGPKHSDVVKYLLEKYPKSKMIADNMIEKMTESSIKELINAYPVTLVSQKRKQLLGIFLKEKVNLLTRLRNEVYGE